MREQSQIQQQRRELDRQLERAQSTGPRLEDDGELDNDSYSRGMMGRGWRHHQDWRRGAVGPGMMGQPGMMGPGNMAPGMMMRMIFTLMDSDGDGSSRLMSFRLPMRASSREWTQTKTAVSPWRRCKPLSKEPGDQLRGSSSHRVTFPT